MTTRARTIDAREPAASPDAGNRTLGIMTIWRRPGLRCELRIGEHVSMLRLLNECVVIREEPTASIDEAIATAHAWEREQPIAKIEAVLQLLSGGPPAGASAPSSVRNPAGRNRASAA